MPKLSSQQPAESISRRTYLKRSLALAGVAVGAGFLQACGKNNANHAAGGNAAGPGTSTRPSTAPAAQTALSCTDISGLTAEQKQTRKESYYVDASPMPNMHCHN